MPVFKIIPKDQDQNTYADINQLTRNILLNDYINKAGYTLFYIINPRNNNNYLNKYKNNNNIYMFNNPNVKHPTDFSLFKMPVDAYIDFTIKIVAPNSQLFNSIDDFIDYPSQPISITEISFDFMNFMYRINNTNINIPFQKTSPFINGTTYGTLYNSPMDDLIYLSTLTSTVEPDPTLNRFHGYISRIDMYIYIGDRSFIRFIDPTLMGNSITSLYTILFDLSIQIFSGKTEDNDLIFNVNCTIPINSNNVLGI